MEPVEPTGKPFRFMVLERIFETFDAWSSRIPIACRANCPICCTLAVTISETEGDRITAHLLRNGPDDVLETLRNLPVTRQRRPTTTNEFANACLEQRSCAEPDTIGPDSTCPFLRDDRCSIYPVRPFGCRCFVSTTTCREGGEATVPAYYPAACSAIMQIIEHLDQGRRWGVMIPLLASLVAPDTRNRNDPFSIAQPIPGFLLTPDEHVQVAPLLESVFNIQIAGTTLRKILDSRQQQPG